MKKSKPNMNLSPGEGLFRVTIVAVFSLFLVGWTFAQDDAPAETDTPSDSPTETSTDASAPVNDDSSTDLQKLDETVVESTRPAPAPVPAPRPAPPAPVPAPVIEPEPVVIDDDSPVAYGQIESSSALFGSLPLIETPFSVGVIGQEIIKERRAFTAADALLYEPSVTRPYGSGFYNRSDFSVRGFAPDTFQSYRIDGLPYVNLVEPPIDDKERIEVLKGPAGLRFGFVPPGGAINYVRKRPTAQPYRSISVDYDTFGGFYSQIDVSDTLSVGGPASVPSGKNPWPEKGVVSDSGPTFGYRAVIAGDKFDDFYDFAEGDRLFGSLFLEWKPNEDVSIWTSISGQNRERQGYGGVVVSNSGTLFDTGVDTNTMQPWGHNRQESLDFAVGADIQLNDNWKMRTSTNYGEIDRSGYQSWAGFVFDNGDYQAFEWLIGTQSWDYWSHHTHFEGEFETAGIQHELVLGGEYRFVESSRSPDPRGSAQIGINNAYNFQYFPWLGVNPVGSIPFYEYSETSFFLTDIIELSDWFSILAGVRYAELQGDFLDQITGAITSSYSDSVYSPTAAVMIEPVENFHTYVSYTQGMTQGGTAPAIAVNALEQLPPLQSRQLEAGIKAELVEDRVYGEFAYFKIEQDLEYLNNNLFYVQDGLRVHEGFEFLLRGQVCENLEIGASAMFLEAVQRDTGNPLLDGRTPDNVPDYKATAWVNYNVPQIPGLSLSLNTVVESDRYADSFEQYTMDKYAILNAGASYRFQSGNKDWTLRAYVENITDERYFYTGYYSDGYGGQLDYGAPVNATFSVEVEF